MLRWSDVEYHRDMIQTDNLAAGSFGTKTHPVVKRFGFGPGIEHDPGLTTLTAPLDGGFNQLRPHTFPLMLGIDSHLSQLARAVTERFEQ